MRVLVTGSHGLIGSALIEALLARGDDVTRLVRTTPAGPGEVSWDPAGGSIDAGGLAGHDAVVHLAGENIGARKWTAEQKARIIDSRRKGTALVAEALAGLPAAERPSVLVSASGINYYGDRGEDEVDESSSAGTGFLTDVTTAWESAAEAAGAGGIRVVRVRNGIVLSAREGALQRQLLPFRLGLGGPLGGGRQWWSWISLQDEVGAILHCIDRTDVSGPVNLVSPSPVRQREFASTLARVLRRPAVLPTPLFPLRARYGSELVTELLLASQRVVPRVLTESGYAFRHPTLEPALRAALSE